jgi:osmotically-inducible protein OsmY
MDLHFSANKYNKRLCSSPDFTLDVLEKAQFLWSLFHLLTPYLITFKMKRMDDKNFNQGQQSRQDWDKDKNRSNQDDKWSSQQSNSNQNRDMNQRYGDVGYSGDSAHGMGARNEGDDNRNRGNRNHENTQFGTSGTQGHRSGGMDYNSGGYNSENRGSFGNAGYGNQYNQQDWNQQRQTGNQHGHDQDWNRRQMGHGGSSWSSDHGWQDRNRSNMNYGNQQAWGNQGYGGNSGNMGHDQNRQWGNMGNEHQQDWNRNQHRGDDRYDSRRHHDQDNNWWERTKDKVSDWFDGDDDKDRNRNRDNSASHRGKGPTDYRRSQDRIREDICDRLTDDDRVDASHIRVQIEDDVVILSGNVNSREEKRRAEDLVESVSGVRNVENRLRVGAGTGVERHLASHDYTGATDKAGSIGTESGTTNEIIRNVQNDDRVSDKEIK